MKTSITKKYKWIYFLSKRFSSVSENSRFAMTRVVPAIGIGFGVMALIVILSVINGFQDNSVNTLVEIKSYHIRVQGNEFFDEAKFIQNCNDLSDIELVTPFIESQGLLVGKKGKQKPALIRAIPEYAYYKDPGFAKELNIYSGEFNFEQPMSICLGSELAKQLGVRVGDKISILALSGGTDVDLLSANRVFTVTSLFFSTLNEINDFYCFISYEDGKSIMGNQLSSFYGIKVNDLQKEMTTINSILRTNDNCTCESWRENNRSYFSALRIEKNVLMLLVLLIFLVVGVNIYNGMRRMVFERREDICVLSALGANKNSIKSVFVLQGLSVGLAGAIPGLVLGILLSVRMDALFSTIAEISYFFQKLITMIVSPDKIYLVRKNTMYLFYAEIPANVKFWEVMYVSIFGVLSSVISSWLASKKIMKFQISEVLRDE